MSEELFFVLTLPFAFTVAAIFIKFLLFCQQAREEEFIAGRKAVALARSIEAKSVFKG